MLFLVIILAPQVLVASKSNSREYESKPSTNLQCKETTWREDMGNISCAITALREPTYNFGFVIHADACLVCRSKGALGDGNVVELPLTGSIYMDGKRCQIAVRRMLWGKTYQWEVNIGSGNDLVPLGNKPLPEAMSIQIMRWNSPSHDISLWTATNSKSDLSAPANKFTFHKVQTIWLFKISHHSDVIISAMAYQITSLMIVYLTVYSRADQTKHQSSTSLAFVRLYMYRNYG